MSKKTTRNIIILAGVLLIGFLVWFIFFRTNNEDSLSNRERDGLSNPFGDFSPEEREDTQNLDDFFEFNPRDSKLRQISASPVSGYRTFEREVVLQNNSFDNFSTSTATSTENTNPVATTTETIVQYVARGSGNIFEISSDTTQQTRVTNTTIPRVQKATFFNNSDNLIYTTLDQQNKETIVNYLADFNEYKNIFNSTSTLDFPMQLQGSFLADNIRNIIISPDDNIFAFLKNVESFNTYSVGYLFEKEDIDNPELIFQSEISDFNPEWVNNTLLSLTTKPSYLSEGFSYVLNTENGEVEKRLGGKIALSTKYSPDNSKILYSEIVNGISNLRLIIEEDNEDLDLGLPILADKCSWSNDSVFIYCGASPTSGQLELPDVWYRGEFNFDDIVIEINTETFENRLVFRREERPYRFDVYNLEVTDNNNYLIFQNKIDLSLWMLDLTE